jgi:hypothetical protein
MTPSLAPTPSSYVPHDPSHTVLHIYLSSGLHVLGGPLPAFHNRSSRAFPYGTPLSLPIPVRLRVSSTRGIPRRRRDRRARQSCLREHPGLGDGLVAWR